MSTVHHFSLIALFTSILAVNMPVNAEDSVEYLGKVGIDHSSQVPVLGISSIRYDEKHHQFFLLSDDTGAVSNHYGEYGIARYYVLDESLVWDGRNVIQPRIDLSNLMQAIELKPADNSASIKGGQVDTEGLALMSNDELLIVSEQNACDGFIFSWNYYFNFLVAYPGYFVKGKLLSVDRTGNITGMYQFPDHYNDNRWRMDIPYVYDFASKDPARKGVTRNKGFESLDRIPGTDEYLAITEAPLMQDERLWLKNNPPVRMLHFSLPSNSGEDKIDVKGEYYYQFNHLPNALTFSAEKGYPSRGVSDIQVINKDTALVLERSYIKYSKYILDTGKVLDKMPQSIGEVYKIKIETSKKIVPSDNSLIFHDTLQNKVLKKELLFSTLQFESKDNLLKTLNIEGITFGPDIGKDKLLVLVNDNDAKVNAPTYLLFFKVPASLLEL